jgi:predicted membrane protein
MNDEQFKSEIHRRWGRRKRGNGNVWTGLFLLIIGGLLMARAAGVFFPGWFFTWPVLLIGLGLFLGVRHRFRGGGWIAMLVIGGVFLADKINDDIYLRPYFWPIALITVGLIIILKPRHRHFRNRPGGNDDDSNDDSNFHSRKSQAFQATPYTEEGVSDHNDVIDVTAIFAGIKKKILSKNFKGGDIVAIMGGAEINLTQADFNGRISIDNFTMFGGTKLIVPPDWDVQSEVVAIFGGVDDKRPPATHHDPTKVVFLEGTCIFGGIEIKSF